MTEHRAHNERGRGPREGQSSEGQVHIDLGLGDFFKGLGGFLDLVGDMAQEGKTEVNRTQEISGPGGVRGVYGLSVKMGLGGNPVVEHFGNVHSTEHGPEVSEVREPLVDIFDEEDHILVIAELPGVDEGGILLNVKDDIVTLSADGRGRKYAKELLLPAIVDPASLRQTFQSGILEVRLTKAQTQKE